MQNQEFKDEFEKDSACIAMSLNMWANYIETGDPVLTREDVISWVLSIKEDRQKAEGLKKLKILNDYQKEFVQRLRRLAKKTQDNDLSP